MIQWDQNLHCQFKKEQLGQVPEKGEEKSLSEHSDWLAVFSVVCEKSPAGTKLTIDFSSFHRINDIDVTILIGELQKSAEVKKKPISIDLI